MQVLHRPIELWRLLVLVSLAFGGIYFFNGTPASGQRDSKPKKIDEDLYTGVQKGMMVPYFGKELPDGFVWADGQTNWPEEDWVPNHLRKNPVPDMRGELIGGASKSDDVGRRFQIGVLSLPDGFLTLVRGDDSKIATGPQSTKLWGLSYRVDDKEVNDPKHSPPYLLPDTNRQMNQQVIPQVIQINVGSYALSTDKAKAVIKLTEKTQNPSYQMCSWIIRVK